MPRTMLLPISIYDDMDAAVDAGLNFALALDAHLSVLVMQPSFRATPGYTASISASGYATVFQEMERASKLREREIESYLVKKAEEVGVVISDVPLSESIATASFIGAQGEYDILIAKFAVVNDLVLFTKTATVSDESDFDLSLVKTVLENSGRPLFIIPENSAFNFGGVAAVAWNGSVEGARAVSAALEFLKSASKVVVITVNTGKTNFDEADRLKSYLGWHGIEAECWKVPGSTDVGADVIHYAIETGADYIVSGGYTRGRLRQALFGGVTTTLLQACKLPMILSR